ncbi:MAG: hypothetical protein ACLTDY_05485 [Dialister invisus]
MALTVLPLTAKSSLAMTAAIFPAVIRLPFVSSVTVSAWSFHPVLPLTAMSFLAIKGSRSY